MEKELTITEARKRLHTLVKHVQCQGDTYVITRYGRPAVAVVPLRVYEVWQDQRRAFFDSVRDMQETANLSPEEAEQIANEAIAAVRSAS
jgi:prevent-host-death family protein